MNTVEKTESLLHFALSYARLGWRVLPCNGKAPLTRHGVHDATTDKGAIRQWWRQWPTANIGIAAGANSGLVVVDIDPRAGGSLESLEREFGPLPPSAPRVRTGGGGWHLYFRHPRWAVRNLKLATGIEIKGDGGYVIAPPSVHPQSLTPYEWERWSDDVLPPAPSALLERLREGNREIPRDPPAPGARIPEGQRNTTLTAAAGALRRQGLPEESIAAALRAINDQQCDPPLPRREVESIAHSVARYEPAVGARRKSAADILLEIVRQQGVELWSTPEGEHFITIPKEEHYEHWSLQGSTAREWLAAQYVAAVGKVPPAQALHDVAHTLSGQALLTGKVYPVRARLAQGEEGAIYLDLCDEAWRAVRVDENGWEVVSRPPVRFFRPKGALPLPLPQEGGRLERLRGYLNLGSEDDWVRVVSWLVMCFSPTGPYPFLILQGEQGTAKSTTARILKALVDPHVAPLRAAPRDERDLMIAARNSWLLAFDNLSGLPNWLSDALARLATGSGFATRTLYENVDETIITAQRPMILNGIDEIAQRGDLRERALIVYPPVIPVEARRDERALWEQFECDRPALLGALLSAAATATRRRGEIILPRKPRMADFALWATAAEPALGWQDGTFIEVYERHQLERESDAAEYDPVVCAIRGMLAECSEWEGTATKLLEALESHVNGQHRYRQGWPATPQALANRVRRSAPLLRAAGIEIDYTRGGKDRRRLIVIRRREGLLS